MPQQADTPFELKFAGRDIRPAAVRARDLAEVINSFDDMLSTSILSENPDVRREDLVISFVHIEDGSVHLRFLPNLRPLALVALQTIATAVSTGEFHGVPRHSVKCLKTIQTFTRRHGCTAELRDHVDAATPLATIDQDTDIAELPFLEGETTLFGEVLRVGGRTPRVMFRLSGDSVLYCDATYPVAKVLGEKLYTWVCVKGAAKWNPETLATEELSIREIISSPSEALTGTMDKLSRVCSRFYADVTDIPAYVSSIRSTGLEVAS
ncbi:MAG: hypothetical protein HN341_18530 [Verrucomicrobia bacterium]|jgi:hypothetical protein|nr:hypothetical protein [Verrucomicrobiota bacterium]